MPFQKGNNLWRNRHSNKHSPETKKKIGLAQLGREFSPEHIEKLRLAKLEEKNHNWKGDNVKYCSLHEWLRNRLPKPIQCPECHQEKSLDLANISGKYLRDVNDYRYLCKSCHLKYDYKMGFRKSKKGSHCSPEQKEKIRQSMLKYRATVRMTCH